VQSKKGGRKMKLWYVPFNSVELKPSSQVYGGNGNRILAAQPFTIELRTVMVGPDLDCWPRGDNDVLISTTSKLGIEPKVDRVHFYREGEFGDALYIYSFEMMVIGGKLVDAGEMFTFTVLIGRAESISKARRDNSTTKGLQPHRSLSPKL